MQKNNPAIAFYYMNSALNIKNVSNPYSFYPEYQVVFIDNTRT